MTLVATTMNQLRRVRQSLDSDVARSICNTHPLSPDYIDSLSFTLRAGADRLWRGVREAFDGLEPEAALRQAWSISPGSALWTGLLFSAANRDSDSVRAEAARLLSLCPELPESAIRGLSRAQHSIETLGFWLLAGEPIERAPTPDMGFETSLRPQWRLRFCMASAVARGESLAQLFRRAAAQPSVSDSYRRSEFLRALRVLRGKTGRTSHLTPSTVVLFDMRELRLLRSMPASWSEFVSPSLARSADPLLELEALLVRRTKIESRLNEIETALQQRAFASVNSLLSELPADPISDAVARARFTLREFAETDEWSHPATKPEWGFWLPLSATAHQRISVWRQRALPAVWAMTPAEVHRAILRKDLPLVGHRRGFFIQDIIAIRRTWSDAEQLELIRSGFGSLIDARSPVWDQLSIGELAAALSSHSPSAVERLATRLRALPDARPWLAAMALGDAEALRTRVERCLRVQGGRAAQREIWSDFCASAVGTPEWRSVRGEATRAVLLLGQAISLRQRGEVPVDAVAQREAVALALHDPAQRPRHVMVLCLRWIALDAEALTALVRIGPWELVRKIARHRLAPPDIRPRIAALMAAPSAHVSSPPVSSPPVSSPPVSSLQVSSLQVSSPHAA
jgi:hypothetical protein